jgi:peptide/nickel transport system substrate-binding protein
MHTLLTKSMAALLLLAVLASCASSVAPTDEPPGPGGEPVVTETGEEQAGGAQPGTEAGEPKVGGTLHSTLETDDPSTLDPVIPIDNAAIFTMLQIYDQLMRINRANEVEPSAAERYDISDDGMTYTFYLRPNGAFGDGAPVTADDVIFSIERLMASENWAHLIPEGTTFEAPDQATVVFHLTAPNAALLSSLAIANASILPKALVEAGGDAFFESPVGSGPFMLTEWVHGERLVLSRNAHYWGAPQPYLDSVVLELISDDNTRMLKFQAGEIDVALAVPYAQVEAIDAIDGASVQVRPMFATQVVHLNTAVEPLNDVNVRIALQYATDRQAHVDAVLFGYGEIATTLWPKGLMFWDESLTGYPFSLEKAKEYMAQSSVPDGFDLTLSYGVGESAAEQSAALLKEEWAEIGVNVEIVPLDGALQIDETIAGSYEAAIIFWTSDIVDPSQLNISHLCALTETMAGGCDEAFDELAAVADTMTDPVEREAAYHELFQLAQDWSWIIPLYYFPSRTAVWDYVQDFELAPTVFARYWEVWLDQ